MNESLERFDETLSITVLKQQVQLIQHIMKDVMKDGEHYGKIPGCGDKPALLKPGAEKLSMTFRMAPTYEVLKTDLPGGHREYQITCSLSHIHSKLFLGQGLGVATTMESKHRFRNAAKKCPVCQKETIIKGRAEYGGGWICYTAKGGCGEKWNDGFKGIENQKVGKVEHENPADFYNTVIKMGKKRAHVDAILTALAASDIFTQDIEEDVGDGKDTDTNAKQETTVSTPTDNKVTNGNGRVLTPAEIKAFMNKCFSLKIPSAEWKQMLKDHDIPSLEKMPSGRYDELFNGLEFLASELNDKK